MKGDELEANKSLAHVYGPASPSKASLYCGLRLADRRRSCPRETCDHPSPTQSSQHSVIRGPRWVHRAGARAWDASLPGHHHPPSRRAHWQQLRGPPGVCLTCA